MLCVRGQRALQEGSLLRMVPNWDCQACRCAIDVHRAAWRASVGHAREGSEVVTPLYPGCTCWVRPGCRGVSRNLALGRMRGLCFH